MGLMDHYIFTPSTNLWKVKRSSRMLTDDDLAAELLQKHRIPLGSLQPTIEKMKVHKAPEKSAKASLSDIEKVYLENMRHLPLRVCKGVDADNPLEFYILLNPGQNKELGYIPLRSDEAAPIAKQIKQGIVSRSKELSVLFREWETKVNEGLAQLNAPRQKKKFLEDALELVQYRSEVPHMYVEESELAQVSEDKETYCLKYLDMSVFKGGPTPDWDDVCRRIIIGSGGNTKYSSAADVFKTYMWSIMNPGNNSRAALWLHGFDGKDGKSSMTSALAEFLGPAQIASISQDSYINQFFNSNLHRKNLAVFSDCKNRRLISEGKIHSVLGQDIVSVEFKGRTAFAAKMTAKIWVNSNLSPDLTWVLHELSRVIYLRIAPPSEDVIKHGDSNFSKRLVEQLPAFLFKCKKIFPKYCKKNSDIDLPPELVELRKECVSEGSFLVENYLKEEFIFEPEQKIELNEYMEHVSKKIKSIRRKHPTLKAIFLEQEIKNRVYRVARKITGGGSVYLKGIGLRTMNDGILADDVLSPPAAASKVFNLGVSKTITESPLNDL